MYICVYMYIHMYMHIYIYTEVLYSLMLEQLQVEQKIRVLFPDC